MPTWIFSKWTAIGVFFIAMLIAVERYGASQYESGEANQLIKQVDAVRIARAETARRLQARLDTVAAQKDAEIQDTLLLLNAARERNARESNEQIKTVLTDSSCNNLGDSFVRMYNDRHAWSAE